MKPKRNERYRYIRLAAALGTVPFMLGVGPLVGYFIGRWLDRRLHTDPWMQFVFLGLGLAATVRYIVRVVRQVQKDVDRL